MKRSLIAAVLFVTLVFSASAGATTIVEPPDAQHPYQAWADESKAPTPEATIEVIEAPYDICGGGAAACTAEHRVWFDSRYFFTEPTRPTFFHEIGHVFDEDLSTVATRHQFRRITGNRRPWDEADITAPGEQFAEHYRRCALMRPNRSGEVCALIRSMPRRLYVA